MKSWRLLAGLMIVGLLTWPNSGSSSPVMGRISEDRLQVPADPPGFWEEKIEFTGGKRACIIVKGDHQPVVDVSISIYDAKDRLVAKDDGKGDLAAVIWYPPEDGVYTVRVTNPNVLINICFIMLR